MKTCEVNNMVTLQFTASELRLIQLAVESLPWTAMDSITDQTYVAVKVQYGLAVLKQSCYTTPQKAL